MPVFSVNSPFFGFATRSVFLFRSRGRQDPDKLRRLEGGATPTWIFVRFAYRCTSVFAPCLAFQCMPREPF